MAGRLAKDSRKIDQAHDKRVWRVVQPIYDRKESFKFAR